MALFSKHFDDTARVDLMVRRMVRDQRAIVLVLDTRSVRLNYKFNNRLSLEVQLEDSDSEMTDKLYNGSTLSHNNTLLLGLRYDF